MSDDMGGGNGAAIGWIREIVLNCQEPWELASLWAGLLGGTPVEWYPGWVTLEPPHGQRLSFQGTGDGAHGTGPGAGVHFDVLVADLAAGHERVIAAGAAFVVERVSPGLALRGNPFADASITIPQATRSAS